MARIFISACSIILYLGVGRSTDAFGVSTARINLAELGTRESDLSMIAFKLPGIPIRRIANKLNPFKGKQSSTKLNDAATTTIPSPPPPVTTSTTDSTLQSLKIGSYFALWYALNIGYNIYNKKVLNAIPTLTYSVAWLQLALGLLYVFPLWALGIRKAPELNNEEVRNLVPVSILHLLTHIGAVVSLGAGAVSFTHVVKAAEPAVSAFLSAVFLRSFLAAPVYLSLLPVMGGVALASLTELSFTWLSFGADMTSNVASAARGIVGKATMNKPKGKNMSTANLYAVMTIIATVLFTPIALAKEYSQIVPVVKSIAQSGNGVKILIEVLLSGLFYYLYNDVAFLCLENVSPVTHALGNTIKRVVIIFTSVLVFGNKLTAQGALGSGIAIFGVLLYSLASNRFKK